MAMSLPSFGPIRARAADRKGGAAALNALLPPVKTPAELAQVGDDRWLSAMTKRIFQAGFHWGVIEKKWPDFETVFDGFEPHRCAMYSDEDLDRFVRDKRIVRNGPKIKTVRENAAFVLELAKEHGSAASFFADWPGERYFELLTVLKKRGSRLGGNTGQYLLRGMGVDSFILSRDVTTALIREGVIDKAPTSQKAMFAVQGAFNHWRDETGLPLTHLSRILAMSVDAPPPGDGMVGL